MSRRQTDFQRFLAEVNKRLQTHGGVRVRELPNHDWRAAYNEGQKPTQAAHDAMLRDHK